MTEKIGLIKNPLTIIAIFAGIAEVSGTIVLPFIEQPNQQLFIYFLIFFPSILVFLFFITLNFNNKVLYAPSDYKDETNYIKINKYDVAKQKSVEIKVPRDDSKKQEILQLTERIEYLNTQIITLETALFQKEKGKKDEEIFVETIGIEFLVSAFENAGLFANHMKQYGINFEIYRVPGDIDRIYSFPELRAIWLGKDIGLELSQLVIKQSKQFYPHLKYIKLSGEERFESHKQVYIGGSTDSAVNRFNCIPLKDSDFETLETFTDIIAFHNYINQFSK